MKNIPDSTAEDVMATQGPVTVRKAQRWQNAQASVTRAVFTLLEFLMTTFSRRLRSYLTRYAVGIIILNGCASGVAAEKLSVAWQFSDHMVLQRQVNVPIFGEGIAGDGITISCHVAEVETLVAQDGKWTALLPPMKAGGPYELMINSSADSLTIKDVLFGDVWLCSGQSNMEWPVGNSDHAAEEIANANHPEIRLMQVGQTVSETPLRNASGKWQICSSTTVRNFSGIGYFFGRDIYRDKQIPIGLIQASWSGSPLESWMSREDVLKLAGERHAYLAESGWLDARKREWNEQMELWRKQTNGTGYHPDTGIADLAKAWPAADGDLTEWRECQLPTSIESIAGAMDGAVWFRKNVDLDEKWLGQKLLLELGAVDDFDQVWFNGVSIGQTGQETESFWKIPRRYRVPADLVKQGRNSLVVRIFDHGGLGGFTGLAEEMNLSVPGGSLKLGLSGAWRFRVEIILQQSPGGLQYLGSALYNGMICPLGPLACKGVIWYQGEANAGRAGNYAACFAAMVKAWRDILKQPELPFLIVQLPNFGRFLAVPAESGWAELRSQQLLATQTIPHVGMSITLDIGNPDDIHPRNKQDFGRRLVLAARQLVYGDAIVGTGPTPGQLMFDNNKVLVEFNNAGNELKSKGDPLSGFELAGKNEVFVWADAQIKGNSVIVSHPGISTPVAVRYAWAANPQNANLCNSAGLPASTFEGFDPRSSRVRP